MPRDINERLSALKSRRTGTDQFARVGAAAQMEILAKSLAEDSYQKRAPGRRYTEYALGSMQEVGEDYTRISLETADRVGKQLESGIMAGGVPLSLRLQGSVPGNIHIRGYSDVDLLVINEEFLTYDRGGARAGSYGATDKTSVGVLQDLRRRSEAILKAKYPTADVDISGGKAIKVSGGSLARSVDVVPSHWHDPTDYQVSWSENDRGVTIFDRSAGSTIQNLPFKHIQLIGERDQTAAWGLKKVIRLSKNVRSDAEREVKLASFDIAAIMYHADIDALRSGFYYELAILAEAQRHLDHLYSNPAYAKTLWVPDGTRKIFDTPEKLDGLLALSSEMDSLAADVAKEQNVQLRDLQPSYSVVRQTLREAYIPSV